MNSANFRLQGRELGVEVATVRGAEAAVGSLHGQFAHTSEDVVDLTERAGPEHLERLEALVLERRRARAKGGT